MGPKEPMPTAFNSPLDSSCRKLIAIARVASGVVVGNCTVFRSPGPVPIPQTNLVPPASIEPNIFSTLAPRSLPHKLCHDKISKFRGSCKAAGRVTGTPALGGFGCPSGWPSVSNFSYTFLNVVQKLVASKFPVTAGASAAQLRRRWHVYTDATTPEPCHDSFDHCGQ